MNDLISIVVPVFRVEKYLRRCVDSIRNQTYQNLEIILVDDGSDDNCPALCDELATQDSRIRVIHRENGGLSAARNSGIDIANGKYIAFVDSDDCISPEYIAFLYRAARDTGCRISQCTFAPFTAEESPAYGNAYAQPTVYSREQMLKYLSASKMNVCSIVAWSKLYDRELFNHVRYTPGKLHEDEFTTYKLFDQVESVAYIDIPLYGYFKNDAGITGVKLHTGRLDALEAFLERYSFYRDKGYDALLPITANHLIDNLVRFAGLKKQAVQPKSYAKRLESLFRQIKNTISPTHLNRHNRILLGLSAQAKHVALNQNAYLLAGRISGALGLGKLRQSLHTMQKNRAYARELKKVLSGYNPSRSILLLGAIEYDNLGDHAIVHAQKLFLQNLFGKDYVIEIRDNLYLHTRKQLKRKISPNTCITIPGGGNMGDLWFSDEQRRRWILEDFPNNPIVVFPQTISYSDTEEGQEKLQESVKLYNAHKNLTLCAREQDSYTRMQALYPNNKVLLMPDIVLSLPVQTAKQPRKGIALCFRQDAERSVDKTLVSQLQERLKEKGLSCFPISTIAPQNVSCGSREKHLKQLWQTLSSAQACITDRLHGMIFCYITHTPCLALDNQNHKIRRTYETWLKKCNYIFFAEADTAETMLDTMLSCTPGNPVISQSDYQQLEATIRNG